MSLKPFSVSCRCTRMQISEESPSAEAGASCKVMRARRMCTFVSSGKCILPAGMGRAGGRNVETWTAASV